MQTSYYCEPDNGRLFLQIEHWLYACEVVSRRFYPVESVDLEQISPWLEPISEAQFLEALYDRVLELVTLSNKAKEICQRAHAGQTDRGGRPYEEHPITVASMCTLEEERIVAYLHDVIEDTSVTAEDLEAEGMPDWVIDCVMRLSKDRSDPAYSYRTYLERIKEEPIARAVKIADLTHNFDPTRLTHIGPEEQKLYRKYQQSLAFLKGEPGTEYIPPEGMSAEEG